MNDRTKMIINWIARAIIAIGFLLASIGKLTSNPQVIGMFENWGYPTRFYLLIGILELVGAILILIPKTVFHTAIGLFIIMIGAMITHIVSDPIINIIRPLVFMSLLSLIIYLSKESA